MFLSKCPGAFSRNRSHLLKLLAYLHDLPRGRGEVLCTCGVMPEVASQVKEYHVVHGKGLNVVVM